MKAPDATTASPFLTVCRFRNKAMHCSCCTVLGTEATARRS